MQVLDTTIANVSIPAIAGDLGVSPTQGAWVITSFAVSNAIAVPLTGWLARRIGEVKLFTIATLLFTLASWGCGLSTSLPMLLAFRVLQGAVAGPMIPLSQSLLLAIYPPAKKGLALALWSMTTLVAPIVGPILGGWLTDNISWPWIFYINIPVGMLAAWITWSILKSRETKTVQLPIDVIGLALLVIGIGSLQIMLDQGRELDWFNSIEIVALAAVAAIALAFLVVWEIYDEHPVVDLTLFKRRNFTIGAVALSLGYGIFFGNVVLVPLWLQTQLNYTATWAGLAAAPIGVLAVLLSPLVGRNIQKVDLRVLTTLAFLVFGVTAFWRSTFTTSVEFSYIAEIQFVQGIAAAFFFVPLVTMVLSGLPPEKIASASGLSNFLRITAGSFGASLTTTLWDRREALHQTRLTEAVTNYYALTRATLDQLQALGMSSAEATASLARTITQQAYMLATDEFFWLSGWLFLLLILIVWLARPPFGQSGGGAAVAD
jgi:DHA2 family multidrug resistance protein